MSSLNISVCAYFWVYTVFDLIWFELEHTHQFVEFNIGKVHASEHKICCFPIFIYFFLVACQLVASPFCACFMVWTDKLIKPLNNSFYQFGTVTRKVNDTGSCFSKSLRAKNLGIVIKWREIGLIFQLTLCQSLEESPHNMNMREKTASLFWIR